MIASAGDCGPVDYVLSGDFPDGTLTLTDRTLSLSSSSGLEMGTYSVQVTATLQNHPTKVTTSSFITTIDSVCTGTSFVARAAKKEVYWHGNDPKEADVTVIDKRSQDDGGDGYSLCGNRIYEITSFRIDCSNYTTLYNSLLTKWGAITFDSVLDVCSDTTSSADYY